jgi:small subunit ribosomal protein S4
MRIKRNRTKFIKRYNMDMGDLKQSKGYTNTRLNIISNKVFLLKQELYPLKNKKIKTRKTTYKKKKLKRILHLLFRLGGRIYRKKIKKRKVNLKKQGELYYKRLMIYRLYRKFYNNLKIKQLKEIYKKVRGNEENYIKCLETRLDMILLRSGLVQSIYEARQFINHKQIIVNGKIAKIPGYTIKVGDMIGFKEGKSKENIIKKIRAQVIRAERPKKTKVPERPRRTIRATGPGYLETNYGLLLTTLIYEPRLSEIKYPFTLKHETNLQFVSLLKKIQRIR